MPDDSKMIFQKHDGSVFCVAISPTNKEIMVSGGEDDKAFVSNTTNNETLFEFGNHKDSVICCGFNGDGKLIMTADMSGTVVVRKSEDGSDVWDFDCGDLEWCRWHSKANVIFAGTVDGDVYMWKIPSGECKIFQTHGSKSTCSALSESGKELFCGYEDGSVKLWDLKAGSAVSHNEGNKDDPVICVACDTTGKVFASGAQSGVIKLYNETGKSLANMNSLSADSEDKSIEGLAFSPECNYIASASLNGVVSIWNLQTHRTRHELKHPAGVSHLICLKCSNTLLTACLDGTLRIWDSNTGALNKELRGHRGNILDLFVFDNEKQVLTAGDDETSRVFEL